MRGGGVVGGMRDGGRGGVQGHGRCGAGVDTKDAGLAVAGGLLGECGRGCGGRVPGRSYLSHGGAAPSAAPAALYRSGGTGRGRGRAGGGKRERGGRGGNRGGGGSVPASPNIDGAASRPSQGDGERRGHRRHRGTGGGPGATAPPNPECTDYPRDAPGPTGCTGPTRDAQIPPPNSGPSGRPNTSGCISPSRRAPTSEQPAPLAELRLPLERSDRTATLRSPANPLPVMHPSAPAEAAQPSPPTTAGPGPGVGGKGVQGHPRHQDRPAGIPLGSGGGAPTTPNGHPTSTGWSRAVLWPPHMNLRPDIRFGHRCPIPIPTAQ